MFKRVDQSPVVARFFEFLTAALSKKRGLLVIVGIVLILISFVLQLSNVFVKSSALDIIGVVALHVGVLIALIGLLLAEALGK